MVAHGEIRCRSLGFRVNTWYCPLIFQTNTFQVVLITDEINTFSVFNYKDDGLQWIKGYHVRYQGKRYFDAQVGFSAGDHLRYRQNTKNYQSWLTAGSLDLLLNHWCSLRLYLSIEIMGTKETEEATPRYTETEKKTNQSLITLLESWIQQIALNCPISFHEMTLNTPLKTSLSLAFFSTAAGDISYKATLLSINSRKTFIQNLS